MSNAGARRGLDHLVLVVNDLDAAEASFAAMGFSMTARAYHPFGTMNNLAIMDGNFIELVGIADPSKIPAHNDTTYSFAARCRDYLDQSGDGVAMVVLDSSDGRADHRQFVDAGFDTFEPVDFSRGARQPGGSEETVSFTICFLMHPSLPNAPHFVCQQHAPQYFWHEEFQTHRNTARRIEDVTIWSDDPDGLAEFYREVFGEDAVTAADGGFNISMARGRLRARSRESAELEYGLKLAANSPQVIAFTVAVGDLDAVRACLATEVNALDDRGDRLRLSAAEGFGAVIDFVQAG